MATQPIHPTKVCTKCGAEKPATLDHFPPNGAALRSRCRPCWREYEREYFWKNRERKREAARRTRDKQDRDVRREKLMAWRAANPDKVRAAEARRAAKIKVDPQRKKRQAERTRLYRERHADRCLAKARAWREANKDKASEYGKRWYYANPDKVAAKRTNRMKTAYGKIIANIELRRSRIAGAEGAFTQDDWLALIKASRRRCYYCGGKLKKFTIDHFIPITRGGSNWPSNLVVACRPCNSSKSNKMPWEWRPDRFTEGCSPR